MIQKQKLSDRFFKNKTFTVVCIALSIVICLMIYIPIKKIYVLPMQRKLQGSWNIEMESSYIERDSVYDFLGIIIHIQKNDTIKLPRIFEEHDIDFKGKTLLDGVFDDEEIAIKWRKRLEEMRQKALGTWEIISTNPDSVFFNVPKNPLHGKYAVRFYIDRDGWVYANMRNNILKIELTNDSTSLICNKAGFIHKNAINDWERRN